MLALLRLWVPHLRSMRAVPAAGPASTKTARITLGLFAAPFGGWVAKRGPARFLMFAVGFLIVALAVWQLARAIKFE